ncbi:MAG: NAD-dependent epimerase/dehydratase family protein [Bacteroidales bacterium]|nr:NAD-dependent epimerase/dehydratase family protein [Bacteroidales bacterium]
MTKVGITGQAGFVGSHLFNYLGLQEGIECIPFTDDIFDDAGQLSAFVSGCDVIVHLAAMNRHPDPEVIYNTNTGLVRKLITALEDSGSKAHVIFSSSTQEELDNLYGKSKKEGREMLQSWAGRSGGRFTGLIIPNVFGPFGKPFYNSFVATFCHLLTHDGEPEIHVDSEVRLIYVNELIAAIYKVVRGDETPSPWVIPHTSQHKVTYIRDLLLNYRDLYLAGGIIPELNSPFEINLFNTFRSYIDPAQRFPVKLIQHTDNRGTFVETIRLGTGGQVSFSTTKPGITRGNHFHTRKIERFAVIRGKASIELRQIGTSQVHRFYLDGNEPSYVDMPVWVTHNITNVGDEELFTIFWINEWFNPDDPDTFFETV